MLNIRCLIIWSEGRLLFVFSGKMYAGNRFDPFPFYAHGQSTTGEESLVISPPTEKKVKTSPI